MTVWSGSAGCSAANALKDDRPRRGGSRSTARFIQADVARSMVQLLVMLICGAAIVEGWWPALLGIGGIGMLLLRLAGAGPG